MESENASSDHPVYAGCPSWLCYVERGSQDGRQSLPEMPSPCIFIKKNCVDGGKLQEKLLLTGAFQFSLFLQLFLAFKNIQQAVYSTPVFPRGVSFLLVDVIYAQICFSRAVVLLLHHYIAYLRRNVLTGGRIGLLSTGQNRGVHCLLQEIPKKMLSFLLLSLPLTSNIILCKTEVSFSLLLYFFSSAFSVPLLNSETPINNSFFF